MSHRQNLRQKFLISQKSLKDYEILEMLLFLAIPRRDTRQMAKHLMLRFGSLSNVLNADKDQLISINGIGSGTVFILQLIHEVLCRAILEDIKVKPIKMDGLDKVEKYCKVRIGHLVHEEMLVLFLNNRMCLITEEVVNTGNHNEVKMYKNIIISKATQNGASGIILAHNHPSGNPEPSISDARITRDLENILYQLELRLYDHIIVSKNDIFSFSKAGLLNPDF